MKLNRLSIFLVFIFIVSILPFNSHCHENRFVQDDSFISAPIDYNLDFSICNVYKPRLIHKFILIIILYNILFTSLILPYKFSTRAPPK